MQFNERQQKEALARSLFYADLDAGVMTDVRTWTEAPHTLRVWYRNRADRRWAEQRQQAVKYERVVWLDLPPTSRPVIGWIGHQARPS